MRERGSREVGERRKDKEIKGQENKFRRKKINKMPERERIGNNERMCGRE